MSPDRTMYDWFAGSVREYPDLIALRASGIDITYQDLDAAAGRAGLDVLECAGGRPRRVGILGSRTAGAYIAYLAGLRLGVTVVPLNTEFPAARNAGIISNAMVEVLLYSDVDKELATALNEATGVHLLEVTEAYALSGATPDARSLPRPHRPGMEELAYIVFTSGSTGTPKGVPIKHTNISIYLDYVIPFFDGGPGVRISQTSDMSWDLSVYNIWVAWGSGGTVIVPSKTDLLTPAKHINDDGITHWFSVPSSITMSRWLGELAPDSMPTLRWSLFGGELLTVDNARAWHEASPQGILANVYGPTETTVTCLTYPLPAQPSAWPRAPLDSLPLGPAYPTVECVVVDDSGRQSREGELLIRGPQRFDGYLDPAHNIGRFAWWEPGEYRVYDGTEELTDRHWYRSGDRVRVQVEGFAFLGRVDNQVKVYGYRVEPGDVEAALRRHRLVDEAVVVPRLAEDGATELAGFYTGAGPCEDELSQFLEGELPGYMVPRFLFWRETFPLTVNGKVDRKYLAEEAVRLGRQA